MIVAWHEVPGLEFGRLQNSWIDRVGSLVAQRMFFVPEGQHDSSLARSAWDSVHRENRPVGYGMIWRNSPRTSHECLSSKMRALIIVEIRYSNY